MIFEMPVKYIVLILVMLIIVVVLGLYNTGAFDALRYALGLIGA